MYASDVLLYACIVTTAQAVSSTANVHNIHFGVPFWWSWSQRKSLNRSGRQSSCQRWPQRGLLLCTRTTSAVLRHCASERTRKTAGSGTGGKWEWCLDEELLRTTHVALEWWKFSYHHLLRCLFPVAGTYQLISLVDLWIAQGNSIHGLTRPSLLLWCNLA